MKRPDKKSLIVNSRNIKNLVKSIKKEMRIGVPLWFVALGGC